MVIVLCDEREFYNQNVRNGIDKSVSTISSFRYNSIIRANSTDLDKTVDSLLNDIDQMLTELKG